MATSTTRQSTTRQGKKKTSPRGYADPAAAAVTDNVSMWVVHLLEETGTTQTELAHETGIPEESISRSLSFGAASRPRVWPLHQIPMLTAFFQERDGKVDEGTFFTPAPRS